VSKGYKQCVKKKSRSQHFEKLVISLELAVAAARGCDVTKVTAGSRRELSLSHITELHAHLAKVRATQPQEFGKRRDRVIAQFLSLSSCLRLWSKAEGQDTTWPRLNAALLPYWIVESTTAPLITINRKAEDQIIQVNTNGLAVRNTVKPRET
jgi:hypothetical protein